MKRPAESSGEIGLAHRFWRDEVDRAGELRIRECFRYAIEELHMIYGSPNRVEGTLRQAIEEVIHEASSYVSKCSYRDSYGMFASKDESTAVRVTLALNPRPVPQDRNIVFVAFSSRYDKTCHQHEAYYPLRSR